jgi:soluble cytochrome b562
MSTDKTITIDEFEKFSAALRGLADASEKAVARMRADKMNDAESTNYQTGVKGFVYVISFIEGLAGKATTAPIRESLKPIHDEHARLEKLKKESKKVSTKAKTARKNKES